MKIHRIKPKLDLATSLTVYKRNFKVWVHQLIIRTANIQLTKNSLYKFAKWHNFERGWHHHNWHNHIRLRAKMFLSDYNQKVFTREVKIKLKMWANLIIWSFTLSSFLASFTSYSLVACDDPDDSILTIKCNCSE